MDMPTDVYFDKVQRMQNRAARVVSGVYDWNLNGMDIVSQLGWQTVRERRDYFTCVLIFKYLHGQALAFLQEKLTFVSHGLSTRAEISGKLVIPQPNVEGFKQCFTYQGPRLWNNSPHDLKNCDSVNILKFYV